MDDTLTRFATQARSARSRSALGILFGRVTRRFGFTAYAVGLLPDGTGDGPGSSEPFLLIDWPRAWLELYAREGFAKEDLLVAEALTRTDPLTWSEFRDRRPDASARIFAAAAAFGWVDGLLVPIRPDDGQDAATVGVVSLASPDRLALDDGSRAEIAAISRVAFTSARAMGNASRPDVTLSERERAALSLVASGYSDAEIGRRLGIAKDTAHLHVERAKRRLGALTRAQAVAIAAEHDLLDGRGGSIAEHKASALGPSRSERSRGGGQNGMSPSRLKLPKSGRSPSGQVGS